MTKKILSIIFIFKMHIILKVCGKVIPLHFPDEYQEQFASDLQVDLKATLEKNNLSVFLELLKMADLQHLLSDKGPYTVFAPNNKAFESLEPIVLQALKEKSTISENVLLSHFVPGDHTSLFLTDGMRLVSESGISLLVKSQNKFTINDVNVVLSDVMASNGVIHVIEEVVHLTSDSDNSKVEDNSNELLENVDINESTQLIGSDIISKLRQKNLSKFLELIEEAGVKNTFTNRKGYPITVFAPANGAFHSFDIQELKDRNHLQSIVFSHILFGEVYYRNLVNGEKLQTIGRSSLFVKTEPNFTINGHIVLDQVLASNGVIYVVSTLLVSPYVEDFTSDYNLPQWAREYLPPPPRSKLADSSTSDNSVIHLCNELKAHGLSTAHDLIIKADLGEKLSEKGPMTMFAPSNAAFALLDSGYESELEAILLNHLINKILTTSDIKDQDVIESLGGAIHKFEIKSTSNATEFLVSGVAITEADIIGTNVVVHVMEQVIPKL